MYDAIDQFVEFLNKFDSLSKEDQFQFAQEKYQERKGPKRELLKRSPIRKVESKLKFDLEEETPAPEMQMYQDLYKKQLLHEMGVSEEGMAIGSRQTERRGLGA